MIYPEVVCLQTLVDHQPEANTVNAVLTNSSEPPLEETKQDETVDSNW